MSRTRSPIDRARDTALILFLAYAAAVNFLAYGDFRTEDAYITFRYAANLAAGDGFVFNLGERVLGTEDPGVTLTLWSDPFRIDFDELAFRFAATHPRRTVAQLFVGGLLTLEVGGTAGEPPAMQPVVLPVHAFRGRVGVLRFVDADREGGFLAADLVESRRYVDPAVFDDFESGAYGDRWRRRLEGPEGDPQPFAAPTPNRELARKHGLHLALGSHAATSLGLEGAGALVSRPFIVERDRMSFVVYDFGGPATRVELEVDGRAVRRFTGARRGLAAVRWDLAPWRGRRAVLAVIDGDEDPERGIGIDSIVEFDRTEPTESPGP